MSFLNTIRGLGRSSKKNKKELETPSASVYGNLASGTTTNTTSTTTGGAPLRRSQSPTKLSPSKQQQQQGGRLAYQQQQQQSPTKRNRMKSPAQLPMQQQLQQQQPMKSTQVQQQPVALPLFLCEPYVKTALVKGSFKTIVQLPKYVDYGEWLALNIFELFNNLNRFYGVISEYVTPEAYPTMNAGPNINYLWVDATGLAVNLPACQYIEYVITWISNKINDQSVFPTKNGGAFPPNFLKDCKNISRQMFRIFAHIYHNHFDKIVHLSLEAHFNSFFAHFISFVKEFNLIDRNELEPLLPLIENFEEQGKII